MKTLALIAISLIVSLNVQSSLAAQIPNGKVTTYYDNGSKMADKMYKDGTPIGTWSSWHNNGNPHSIIEFLEETGQIKELRVLYESGALLYKGVASIKNQEEKEKDMIMHIGGCSARSTMQGNGSKWYNKYELNYSSFYEDGSCEKTEKENIARVIGQLYFRVTDTTTGNIHDFPWYKLWDTVPDFLKKKEGDSKQPTN